MTTLAPVPSAQVILEEVRLEKAQQEMHDIEALRAIVQTGYPPKS